MMKRYSLFALIAFLSLACGSHTETFNPDVIDIATDGVDVNSQIHIEYYDSLYEAKEDSMAYLEWKVDQQYKDSFK